MQHRRATTTTNPFSLPITSNDFKKQSHRSRLQRGGYTPPKRKSTSYTISFYALIAIFISFVSVLYFLFDSTEKRSIGTTTTNELLNDLEKFKDKGSITISKLGDGGWKHLHKDDLENRKNAFGPVNSDANRNELHDADTHDKSNKENVKPIDLELNVVNTNSKMDENQINNENADTIKTEEDNNANENVDIIGLNEINHSNENADSKDAIKKENSNEILVDQNPIQQQEQKPILNIKEYLESISLFHNIKTKYIGFYFVASWCRISQPATEALESAFLDSNALLLPNNLHQAGKELAIIYISSDRTQIEKEFYAINHNWLIPVPNDISNTIKSLFHTCAQEEVSVVNNMERKFGIPRLVILDNGDKNVITTDGINDVINYGTTCFKRWDNLKVKDKVR